MKTMTKKLGSIVLALCLCFSLCCTAFAVSSPEKTGSITIDGYAGEEYTIYQMLDLTYETDEEGNITSYSYTVVSPWETFLDGYSQFTLTPVDGVIYVDPSSTIFTENYGGLDLAAFAKAAIAFAEDESNNVTATAGPTAATAIEGAEPDENNMKKGSVTFSNLNLGYYVVSSSIGTVCSLDTTNPDVTIDDKNTVPVVHKYLADTNYGESFDSDNDGEDDRKVDDADNDDTMTYELVIDNVAHVKNLVVHDYLDEDQLDIETIEITSIILYVSDEDENGTDIYSDCDITQSTCDNGENCGLKGCSFEIDIPDAILDGENVTDTAYVKIIYTISLNEDVDHFVDDVDEIDNYVNITFGAAAVGVPDEVETYSYGFKIYKYTGEIENSEDEALAGAKFVLSKEVTEIVEGQEVTSTKYAKFTTEKNESGETIYLFDKWVDTLDEATEMVSDEEGMIHMDGLHEGTFALTETEAPDGYNKLDQPYSVTITATDNYGGFTVNNSTTHQVNVENNVGQKLPGTGGIGTTIFYIIGGVLVAGAVVVLITRRRMSHEA